jgi:hypothetical protein
MLTDAKTSLIASSLDRDSHELALSDTLDVKAGLLLVALTFLGTQVTDIFAGQLRGFENYLEGISISALVIGGVLAIVQLWPRDYKVPPAPRKYSTWLAEVQNYFSGSHQADREALQYISETQLHQVIERIEENTRLNRQKWQLMEFCFICVAISFAANLLTIIARHLF